MGGIRRGTIAGLLLLSSATTPAAPVPLQPGHPIERALNAGERHEFAITVSAGDYLRVSVDQRGVDVVAALLASDGSEITRVDGYSNGSHGAEVLALVAAAGGEYLLAVWPSDAHPQPGRYEARIDELRPATPADRTRVEAEHLYWSGQFQRAAGTEQSLRQSLDLYTKAADLWRAAGEQDREAQAIHTRGLSHWLLSEYESALDDYTRALALRRLTGNRAGEASELNGISTAHSMLGHLDDSIQAQQQALPIWREIGDRVGEARSLSNIANEYETLGEYQRALDVYRDAIAVYRASQARYDEATALENVGYLEARLGDGEAAMDAYQQARALFQQVGHRNGEAMCDTLIGQRHAAAGAVQQARAAYEEALRMWRTTGDRFGEATTLMYLGGLELRSDPRAAERLFTDSLAVARNAGYRKGEANALTGLGMARGRIGETGAADALRSAVDIAAAIHDAQAEAGAQYALAREQQRAGDVEGARTHVERAIALDESMRSSVAGAAARAGFLSSVDEHYHLAIDLFAEMHHRNPDGGFDRLALQASERARARSLLDLLTDAGADPRASLDPALVARDQAARRALSAALARQERAGRSSAADRASAAATVREAAAEVDRVEAEMRRSPGYAALASTDPLDVSAIQALLDADTVVIEYALGEESSHAWAVTSRAVHAVDFAGRGPVERDVRALYEAWANGRSTPARLPEHVSDVLLGPFAADLGAKRVVIVADGALQYLPFAALPAPGGSLAPLSASHEIVNLPSASVLPALRHLETRPRATRTVAVLADPVFDREDARVAQAQAAGHAVPAAQSAPQGSLLHATRDAGIVAGDGPPPRLAFSRREANAIVSLAGQQGSLRALDFDATRDLAMGAELRQYRFVHFATHGIVDSVHPELSGLVLSLVDRQGRPTDGFLRLDDIYALHLNADLVTLSACRTALGQDLRGEGLVGPIRGFMYAGAPRVVASLWKVEDAPTAAFMERFYRGLLVERLPAAAALRVAQRTLAREPRWRSPHYWAAFELQGDWR